MSDDIPKAVKLAVDARDLGFCRRTGWFAGRSRNFHHRKLRSRGGLHTPGNLISLSGSGTTGTHGWAHAHPAEATHLGFVVPSWIDDPAEVPIQVKDSRGHLHWALLDDDAGITEITDDQAETTMRRLGIWPQDN